MRALQASGGAECSAQPAKESAETQASEQQSGPEKLASPTKKAKTFHKPEGFGGKTGKVAEGCACCEHARDRFQRCRVCLFCLKYMRQCSGHVRQVQLEDAALKARVVQASLKERSQKKQESEADVLRTIATCLRSLESRLPTA